MISNLIISLEAVAPMFIIMSIGVLVKRVGWINDEEARKFNKIVFMVFFPFNMITNTYGKDIESSLNFDLLAFCVISILTVYALTTLLVLKIEKDHRNRGAMIQAIYRSNFVIMGIPVVTNIFGKGDLAVTTFMIATIVPLYNILAVTTLEIFRGNKPSIKKILLGLAKNPLIMGAVAGFVLTALKIKLPLLVENTMYMMSDVATPLALFILGTSVDLTSIKAEKRNLTICVVGRLVVIPGIVLSIAALLGFRGVPFVIMIAIFAAPTAVSSYTMAQQMGSNGRLAGDAVIFSSLLSSFTLFLWIFIFKTLGMF